MRHRAWTIGLAFSVFIVVGAAPASREAIEEAYRANNRGVAFLEQYLHEDAAGEFRRALSLHPALGLARVNLAIALFNVPDLPGAEKEARAAVEAVPGALQPHYVLGLIARGQGRPEEARAAFEKVLAADPRDVGALVNLGQIHMQERRFTEAVAAFRTAVDAEPYSATAAYNVGLALARAGQGEEGRRAMERFQALREAGYGTVLGQTYPDQGRYAEAVVSTGAEPDLVDSATPKVAFVDATASWLPPTAAEADAGDAVRPRLLPPVLVDLDGDGDLDLVDIRPRGLRALRNEAGRWTDATATLGLEGAHGGHGGLAADLDNDSQPDLLVLRAKGVGLYLRTEAGFRDGTARSGLPESGVVAAAALGDFDHDGDLDLLVAFQEGASRLLRNTGEGVFTDVTGPAGLGLPGATAGLVPTDFDNRRDLDLLHVVRDRRPALFRNLRDGTFRDVAEEVGLPGAASWRAVAAGDVNKDSFTDFLLGVDGGPDVLVASDGRGGFTTSPAPGGSSGSLSAQFLDYDNDGLLDLVLVSATGARVLRNLGRRWDDVTRTAFPAAAESAGGAFASGDLDGDGDTDLVLRLPSGALRLLRNDGGERSGSLRVRLAGLVSNRSGVGAKLEARAGSLRQKLEPCAATPPSAPADVVFGLGTRERADALRILWPSGVLQTEMIEDRRRTASLEVKELDRKPSSCPYLYAWDGAAFEFVTDFMGGGEMGYWAGPGAWNHPDPDEYVRLTDGQIRARDGRYELRVTNELEEVLFLDHFRLLAVDHPADVEVHPNEGMVGAPRPFRLHAVADLSPPAAAVDDRGRDVLDRLRELDRRFVDGFSLHRIRGYAEEHALVLDVGAADLLLLTGWTDYAFSSDNVAASQAGLAMQPPRLEVEDGRGGWKAVGSVGVPVGRPQTVVVDLAEAPRGPRRRVRVVTNMRIYWDRARVGTARRDLELEPRVLPVEAQELRERGFSAEVTPDGKEPFGYDYARVSWASPWKLVPGRYTRAGDVRELLDRTDDLFVISRPGDEVALAFTAPPPPPAGWRRTFLFYADGFSKEMDINSATPDSMGPLPFHAMTRYPYLPPEAYPMTEARRAVYERYNTRVVREPLPLIDTAIARARDLEEAR